MFNDILLYIHMYMKMVRKKSNHILIVKLNLRNKQIEQTTPRIEDYELFCHYCTGIQESFQAS